MNLANRLESLSAYRHVFPPNSPDAAQNPVSYSHLRITVGGRPLSILSRISDYGVDYSKRTNKLAHHVVVEGPDLVPAGPAWVLSQPAIMRSQWDGQCTTPATGPTVPPSNQSARVCLRWSGLCNDAGWGGVVAEAFAQPPGKPLWIIFTLAQSAELLGLINESIALLPVEQRWQATFSTYATNLPPDADCKVRCVLAGTDDARLAPARGKVIDLSKPLPSIAPAGTTAFVLAARNGTIPLTPQALRPIGTPSTPTRMHGVASDSAPALELAPQLELKLEPSSSKPSRFPAVPPAMKNSTFPAGTATNQSPYSAAKRQLNWAIIGLSIAASLLLVATFALLVQRNKTTEIATANKDTSSENSDERSKPTEDAKADEANAAEHAKSKGKNANPSVEVNADENSKDGQTQSETASDTTSKPQPPADKVSPNALPENAPPKPYIQIGTPQPPANEQATTVEAKPNEVMTNEAVNKETAKTETPDEGKAEPTQTVATSEEPIFLPGKLQTAKLFKGDSKGDFKGELCVQIEILLPRSVPPKAAKFAYKKDKRGPQSLPLGGMVSTDDARPLKIKSILCKHDPFVLVVEVDPKDEELLSHANVISVCWKALQKDIGDWQKGVKNSSLQSKQKQELALEKLEEPSEALPIVEIAKELTAYAKSISRVTETVADYEDNMAKEKNKEQASVAYAPYKNQLKRIDDNLTKILTALDAITKIKREFDTGTIMYISEKVAAGKLVEPTEIRATFKIDPQDNAENFLKIAGNW